MEIKFVVRFSVIKVVFAIKIHFTDLHIHALPSFSSSQYSLLVANPSKIQTQDAAILTKLSNSYKAVHSESRTVVSVHVLADLCISSSGFVVEVEKWRGRHYRYPIPCCWKLSWKPSGAFTIFHPYQYNFPP
jgi:hypothetical protein